MSECYPTGCTPCTSPIEFPEMPVDGDRYCVPIGSNGEQKCWVYDKCIPGWRAEGPATSPTRYRGLINPCTTPPADDIEAGDWYIISADKADPCFQDPRWGLNLGDFKQGDRIAYNGTTWESFPPPEVPYAEEARDGDKPSPDDRIGGIVKNATVNQAIAGTDKCDSITPYTLNAVIQPIKDVIDDLPDDVASTDDILWEINDASRLAPKSDQNDLLISAFTVVDDNQSIAGKLQLGTTDEAINNTMDPAANDGRLTLASGTIKIEDAADQVPATETRFAVFDENGYIIVGGDPADIPPPGSGGGSEDLVLQNESSTSTGRENDTRNAKALNIPSWSGLNADSQTTFTAYVSQNNSNVYGNINFRIQVQKAGLGSLASDDADIFARASASTSLRAVWIINDPEYNPPTVNWTEVTIPDTGGVPAELWVYHSTGGVTSGSRLVGARFNTTLYYKS